MISLTMAMISPWSLICTRPFSLTTLSGSLPETIISSNTALAILPLMVPASIMARRAARFSGETGHWLMSMASSPFINRISSVISQLPSFLALGYRA